MLNVLKKEQKTERKHYFLISKPQGFFNIHLF